MSEALAWLTLSQHLSARAAQQEVEKAGSALTLVRRSGWRLAEEPSTAWLARNQPDYPAGLLELVDPPPVLYYQGLGWPDPTRPRVAVVGTRRASRYGLRVAYQLGRDLGEAGVVVVSGLALGVDGAAHRGALDALGSESLVSIGVLGCGLAVEYPRQHAALRVRLAERGLVVSEYSGLEPPRPWRFPARNRILAALSRAVVVVEAPEGSGALVTVDHALDLGREVLVVPGPVGCPLSEGSNRLLREGAALVRGGSDVLECLGHSYRGKASVGPGDPWLRALSPCGTGLEELAALTGQRLTELLPRITEWELLGWVRRGHDGRLYRA